MGGGAGRNRRRGKAIDRGDAPDDYAYLIDLFASEYGWTAEEIDKLPIDETARLLHAILYRKGAKVYRRMVQTERYEISLEELIQQRKQLEIDTAELEKGITWHSP